MSLIADVFLASGAIIAAMYCLILSRRLQKFADMEQGVGSAISLLAKRAESLEKSVQGAQQTAQSSITQLEGVSNRAETAARHLELLVASLHSLPDTAFPTPINNSPFRARQAAKADEGVKQ